MFKKLFGVLLMLVLGATVLLADEAKGKLTKWDKGTATVKVGDKDIEYKVGKDGSLSKIGETTAALAPGLSGLAGN